jgi:alpha-glucoside transport system permease protein
LVVTTDTEVAPPPPPEARPPEEHKSNFATHLLRIGVSLVVPVLAIVGLYYAGTVVLDEDANRVLVVVMAILIGVGGVFGLFLGMDRVVNRLPERHREAVRPFAFVGPAVVLLAIFLLYPTINTIVLSFQDTRGESFVGFENYVKVFTDSSLLV